MAVPLVMTLDKGWFDESVRYQFCFFMLLIIFLSDVLDGPLARWTDQVTNIGKIIDPVADKICMMVVVIYLIISYKFPFLVLFLSLAIRDTFLIIIGVYLMFSQEEVFQSNTSGKWFMGISTIMMALFMFQTVLHLPGYILWLFYLVSLCLFIFSTIEYITRYLHYFKELEVE